MGCRSLFDTRTEKIKGIKNKDNYYLKADKENYPAINLYEYVDIQIWGVAIYSIHELKKQKV